MFFVRRCLARVRKTLISLIVAILLFLYGTAFVIPGRRDPAPRDMRGQPAQSGPVSARDSSHSSGTIVQHRTEHRPSLLSTPAASPKTAPPSTEPRTRVLLYWTSVFNDLDFRLGFGNAPFDGCPVSNCIAINSRSQIPLADGVFFHARDIDEKDLPKYRRPQQKFIFVNQEGPFLTWLNLKNFDGYFNLTMTYSRDSDIYYPYGETVSGKQEENVNDFYQRKPTAAWLVSHCETHSEREKYVEELEKYIPVVKIGQCGPHDCDAPIEECYRRMAAENLFYLAFENSLCDDYITEKFWEALRVGMVPVVRGPGLEAYRRVAPPHSFIHVQEYAGPAALAAYLVSLARNRTAYSEYHSWRATHRVQERRSMCDVCAELWKKPGGSRQVPISDVWSDRKHCRRARDVRVDNVVDMVFLLKSKLVRRRHQQLEAAMNRSRVVDPRTPALPRGP